jgi:hypothetical protein
MTAYHEELEAKMRAEHHELLYGCDIRSLPRLFGPILF